LELFQKKLEKERIPVAGSFPQKGISTNGGICKDNRVCNNRISTNLCVCAILTVKKNSYCQIQIPLTLMLDPTNIYKANIKICIYSYAVVSNNEQRIVGSQSSILLQSHCTQHNTKCFEFGTRVLYYPITNYH
jgi:hypothetical protein